MTDKVDFKPLTIMGRKITFRMPNTVQLAMLRRAGLVAGAAGEQLDKLEKDDKAGREAALEKGLEAVAKSLDLVEGMVFLEADREWLVGQMIAGNLDIDEVFEAMKQLVPEDGKAVAAAPVKKARRAA